MAWEATLEAVSAGTGSAVIVGEATRRYWHRREERQQRAFRAAVQAIVDERNAEVLRRLDGIEKKINRL